MFLRFEAELNGGKFSAIAPELVLIDVIEREAAMDMVTAQYANKPGQRVSSNLRTSLAVQLVYLINTQDIVRRAEIGNLITAWGKNGGLLQVNYRPGLQLDVTMDTPPTINSALRWTQELTLTFTAHRQPYWTDAEAVQETIETTLKSDGTGYQSLFASIRMGGNVDHVPVDCSIINVGDTDLTNVRVDIGSTSITLAGMTVPVGGTIMMDYANGLLSIYNLSDTTESYLYARTPQSSDDLLANVGYNNVYIESNTQVQVLLFGRGWWM